MRLPRWICKICEQTFTRRWNADRHCNNKHNCIFDAVIPFKVFASQKIIDPYQNTNNLQETYSSNIYNDSYFQNNLLHQSPQHTSDDSLDYFERDEMLIDILHDIAPKYKELEEMLNGIPEVNKRHLLGSIVTQSLASSDPVNYITLMLKTARNLTYASMLKDVGIYLGVDPNAGMWC